MVAQVLAWVGLVVGGIGLTGYLLVLCSGRATLDDQPPEHSSASEVRLGSVIPLSICLLIVSKAARRVFDPAAGSVTDDLLNGGSLVALVGVVVGWVGRIWLRRSTRREDPPRSRADSRAEPVS